MNTSLLVNQAVPSVTGAPARRSISDLLAPLERTGARSTSLIPNHGATFESGGQRHELPRYLFIGGKGGGEPLRIGIFAGVHGDEPEGVHALLKFVSLLERQPELATGYCLFLYPVCNPTGFEDRTRLSRSGKDINREFWRGSTEPEVRLLQSELVAHSFDGIISLHTDDTSHGFYGYAHGATLAKNLIKPALEAASEFLPVNQLEIIDGFRARKGVIRDGFEGVLSAPPKSARVRSNSRSNRRPMLRLISRKPPSSPRSAPFWSATANSSLTRQISDAHFSSRNSFEDFRPSSASTLSSFG